MRDEIVQARAEAAAARDAAQRSPGAARWYEIVADEFRNEEDASRQLIELLDAGFDATLVSGSSDGVIVYELHVGPFDSLDAAERVAQVLGESYGFAPYVTVTAPPVDPGVFDADVPDSSEPTPEPTPSPSPTPSPTPDATSDSGPDAAWDAINDPSPEGGRSDPS
jgi:hypothetical protein